MEALMLWALLLFQVQHENELSTAVVRLRDGSTLSINASLFDPAIHTLAEEGEARSFDPRGVVRGYSSGLVTCEYSSERIRPWYPVTVTWRELRDPRRDVGDHCTTRGPRVLVLGLDFLDSMMVGTVVSDTYRREDNSRTLVIETIQGAAPEREKRLMGPKRAFPHPPSADDH